MIMIKVLSPRNAGDLRVWVEDGLSLHGFRRLADVKADPRYRCHRIVLIHRSNGLATGVLRTYAEQREAELCAENARDEVAIRAEAPFRDWRY